MDHGTTGESDVTAAARQMKLGLFIRPCGHHIASWRHPGAQADAAVNLSHYLQLAKSAEAAFLDFCFFADASGVRDAPFEILSRSAQYTAYFEPVTLLTAMSTVTSKIGLVATASTSYSEPYNIARHFGSLDHISSGRFVLGVGSGWFERDYTEYGYDFGTAPGRL